MQSLEQFYPLCQFTTVQTSKLTEQSFLSNSSTSTQHASLEVGGRQSGQAWSAALLTISSPLSTMCYSGLYMAPALHVLCHGGSPSSMGCTSFACRALQQFPVWCNTTSSTLREKKRNKGVFFNSKGLPKATQIHFHIYFRTSPAQAV